MQANELATSEEGCCPEKGTDSGSACFLSETFQSSAKPGLPLFFPECWSLLLTLHLGVQDTLSVEGFYLRVVVLGITLRPGQC